MTKKPTKIILKELTTELDVFDSMFSALVELLEDKGIITQGEFEDKMKAKIEAMKGKKSYRDIQLDKSEM